MLNAKTPGCGVAEWSSVVSYQFVQLLFPRACPTSCPNAVLDNKDPSVQEAEKRGGWRVEGSCKYKSTDCMQHCRKCGLQQPGSHFCLSHDRQTKCQGTLWRTGRNLRTVWIHCIRFLYCHHYVYSILMMSLCKLCCSTLSRAHWGWTMTKSINTLIFTTWINIDDYGYKHPFRPGG